MSTSTDTSIYYFDTHAAVKELSNAGFEVDKAEAIIRCIDHNSKRQQKELATKGDVENITLALQKEIEEVRGEVKRVELSLRKEIKDVELTIQQTINDKSITLVLWIAGMFIANTGIWMTLLRFINF